MLEIVLTPSNRTVESVEASGGPETVTLTDGTPPDHFLCTLNIFP